jgi:hypothetical protein
VREGHVYGRLPRDGGSDAIAPVQPWDHPDLVLARAVAASVISAGEANLISATRLGDTSVAECAAGLGVTARLARQVRLRAERRLVAAIRSGDVSSTTPLWPASNISRQARRNGVTIAATPEPDSDTLLGGCWAATPSNRRRREPNSRH